MTEDPSDHFDHHKLKGLERRAYVRSWNEEVEGIKGETVLIAAYAALTLQSYRDPYSARTAIEAWTDAIWGGIIDC